MQVGRGIHAAWAGSCPVRGLCASQLSAAQQQSTRGASAVPDSGAPADALAIPSEDDARALMEDIPVAPQPIFTRKLSKDELQKLRENIPIQREPLYQPVRCLQTSPDVMAAPSALRQQKHNDVFTGTIDQKGTSILSYFQGFWRI